MTTETETPTTGKKFKRLVVELWHDPDCENPLDDADWELHSFSDRHSNFKDPYEFFTHEQTSDGDPIPKDVGLRRKLEVGTAFVCSCYQHSGTAWSLMNEGTQDGFDTARVAGLLVFTESPRGFCTSKDKNDKRTLCERRKEVARSILNVYSEWCEGNCHGFTIVDQDENEVYSASGYVGDEDRMFADILGYTKDAGQVVMWGEEQWLVNYHDVCPKGTPLAMVKDPDAVDEDDFEPAKRGPDASPPNG